MHAPAYRGTVAALSLSFVLHVLLFVALFLWFAGRTHEDAEPSTRLRLRLMQPSVPEAKPPPETVPQPRQAPPQAAPKPAKPAPVEPALVEPGPEESLNTRRMTDQALESIRAYAPPPNADPYAPQLNVSGAGEAIETYRGAGGTFHVRIGKRCFEFDAANDLDSLAPPAVWRFARCPPTD